jgi:transposase InsO family protein
MDRGAEDETPYPEQSRGGSCTWAAIQDAFSRRIVGWSMAEHMRAELVVDALDQDDRPLPRRDLGAVADLGRARALKPRLAGRDHDPKTVAEIERLRRQRTATHSDRTANAKEVAAA